ncbi:HTH-type transcriptional activator RhaS [Rubritalea halochordaticola]|uniref:HTH-type transcriptional activator RhaS n=1 Tax=Rubritalea halochordaticola TaxID=714537 RepID=A0ABP9UWE8_9BACT
MVKFNQDAHVYGARSTWFSIVAKPGSERRLLKDAAVCTWFSQHRIMHAGVMDACYPYAVMRVNPAGTFFMACTSGEGEVLVDGVWKTLKIGHACLLPPYVANAFRCIEGKRWTFAWVRYDEVKGEKTVATHQAPVIGKYPVENIDRVVRGIQSECLLDGREDLLALWSDLLHRHVLGFAAPKKVDDRLVRIWGYVSQDISRKWTLDELADLGHLSGEHLRRLCKRDLGRSPLQHLIYMRLMRARKLLLETDDTVEAISEQVGYESGFSFSNTFKKWMGCRPSDLRS